MDRQERAGLPSPVEQQHRQSSKTNRRAPVKALASESGRDKFGANSVRLSNTAGPFTLSDGYWAAAAAWSVGVILSTT